MSELFHIEPTTSPDAELARARAEYERLGGILREAEEIGDDSAGFAAREFDKARHRLRLLERAALARLKH